MNPDDFQEFVQRACTKFGVSKMRLAAALGCSKNSITQWERTGAPFYIDLAAAALMKGLKPFSKTA